MRACDRNAIGRGRTGAAVCADGVVPDCAAVSGIVDGNVGEGAHTPASQLKDGSVPTAFLGGGPIVTSSRPEQGGLRVPDGHVVLTFDDGPSEWTEQILDLLRARQVRASFFVVGARAAARPDLVRRMYAEGH
jgi:hypothetical protein